MSTFKEIVTKILDEKYLSQSEAQKAFEAISEILEAAAQQVEDNEPYATECIARFKEVASDIYDMDQFIENYTY